ncbi:MAG: SCO family protein [Verrucomicrobiota bacterium]|jgi:protein SCO1/2|nr:SCO family protein [Verrucomicrobiota bacterium]
MAANSEILSLIKWTLLGVLLPVIFLFIYFKFGRNPVSLTTANATPVSEGNNLPIISRITPFTLTNQHNRPIGLTNYLGTPWIADIIFTRCPTICPGLTRTLSSLQTELGSGVRFMTLTTDPSHDTPEKLLQFSRLHGQSSTNWNFLTGPKETLMKLAVDDLKLVSHPKEKSKQTSPHDLFVHSGNLILVDAEGRVRATFEHDSTNLIKRIRFSLKQLQEEQ